MCNFFNVSVFIAIVMNRSLRSENRFMYMLSTCLSDIFMGVSYYYAGVMDVRDYYESPYRTFYIVSTFLGLFYMAILAAQADRYHAVTAPFKYSQRMTRNRTLLVILAYWVYAFLIVAVNNLVTLGVAKRVTSFGAFVANIFTVIIMIGLNIRLFFIAKFQLQCEPSSAERDNKRASIYLIIIVAVCFLIAWLTIFLHVIGCNFAGSMCYTFRNEGSDSLHILPRVNAVLTPLLNIRGCSALRSTLLSKVWRTTCCKRKGKNYEKALEAPQDRHGQDHRTGKSRAKQTDRRPWRSWELWPRRSGCRHRASGVPLKSGNTSPPLVTCPPCWSRQDCLKTNGGKRSCIFFLDKNTMMFTFISRFQWFVIYMELKITVSSYLAIYAWEMINFL